MYLRMKWKSDCNRAFQGVASLGAVLLAEVEAHLEAAHQAVGVQQAEEEEETN